MPTRYRLATFVLAGGYCGVVVLSTIYVSTPDRFGFSVYKYQQWCLVGLIAGLFAGLGAELAVRIAQRPGSRFSIREFMIAIAIVSAAIVVCGAMVRWAKTSSDRGVNNAGVIIKDSTGREHHR
jgi:hypothetical protein